MVAMSLYRGRLHEVSSAAPRRWTMPPRSLSLQDFRRLSARRAKALLLLSRPQPANPTPHDTPTKVQVSDKEGRKRKLETDLHDLNGRKHILVQLLKQVINAEEEMKRPTNTQSITTRATILPQTDATMGNAPVPRYVAPKLNVEVNFGGDPVGESTSPNAQPHHIHTMTIPCSPPSAASPLSRTPNGPSQHTSVLSSHRTSSIPTRNSQSASTMFSERMSASSPLGNSSVYQGHPTNLHPSSNPGTHFSASSPSPPATGANSVFKSPST